MFFSLNSNTHSISWLSYGGDNLLLPSAGDLATRQPVKIIHLQHPSSSPKATLTLSSSANSHGAFSTWKAKVKRMTFMDWIQLFLPCSHWISTYKWREYLHPDLMAGITVGIMLVPQSMSYAKLAGLRPHLWTLFWFCSYIRVYHFRVVSPACHRACCLDVPLGLKCIGKHSGLIGTVVHRSCSTAGTYGWCFGMYYGAFKVDEILQGLPKFSVPKEFGHIKSLIPTTFVITGVAILESVGIAKALAAKNGYELDSNQELFGLGVANIVGSFFSAYPTTGSFSRSAVNHESGA